MSLPPVSVFTDLVNTYLPEPHALLLNGILLGTPVKSDPALYKLLKEVGLLHLVVLSGMNISILASTCMQLAGKISRKIALVITAIFICIFICFVGFQAPIVRSALMYYFTSVGIWIGKRSLSFLSLIVSGLVIMLVWPEWISTLSFQLSYAATIGLILFSPRRESSPKTEERGFRLQIISMVKAELQLSLAAQVFTAPLIFIYFKQISLISPVANILVAWTIAPLMFFGGLTLILGKIAFVLGIIPAFLSYGLLTYILWVITFLSHIPFSFISLP
ncbi:ComEC/Rec2 family competence protein [Candidatus Roizmanbacteria bacterium]|nr:ComEC/Rec2 family competence protein [Candidatus Roizmanbacteria bacterium]